MESEASLGDLLNGTEPEAVEQTVEVEAVEAEAPPRDEQGRFAPKDAGETVATPEEGPPPSEPEPSQIPLAALQDERTKRQRAEDEARQMREALAQYEAYFQQQAQPQIDPEADPIAYVAQQVREQLAPQFEQQILAARVQATEAMARDRWADYDAKVELFTQEMQQNPFLLQQLVKAPDPASYAYNVAQQIEQARQYGGQPMPSREQIEAEMREKILAEIGMSNRQPPVSLATERSVGARSGPAWSGPKSLNELLG